MMGGMVVMVVTVVVIEVMVGFTCIVGIPLK